jgi:hypothetical protein
MKRDYQLTLPQTTEIFDCPFGVVSNFYIQRMKLDLESTARDAYDNNSAFSKGPSKTETNNRKPKHLP